VLLALTLQSYLHVKRWLHYTIIYSGDLDKVKLLRRRGIAWDVDTPAYAAAGGHLHILQVVNTTTTIACCVNLLLLLQ
jgi:hypothetical protein